MRGLPVSAACWSAGVLGSAEIPRSARCSAGQVPGSDCSGATSVSPSAIPAVPAASSAASARYGLAEASDVFSSMLACSAPSRSEPGT